MCFILKDIQNLKSGKLQFYVLLNKKRNCGPLASLVAQPFLVEAGGPITTS
jgi:hypothetical protein